MASRKAENEILESNGYLQGRDGTRRLHSVSHAVIGCLGADLGGFAIHMTMRRSVIVAHAQCSGRVFMRDCAESSTTNSRMKPRD